MFENPFRPPDPIVKPDANAVSTAVLLKFATHNDDKNNDTKLNVHIVNRLNANSNQDLAIGLDLFRGERFPDTGPASDRYKSFRWSAQDGKLPSSSIRLQDMVLPVVIIMYAGTDQWIFDYQVTFAFTDPQKNQGKQAFRLVPGRAVSTLRAPDSSPTFPRPCRTLLRGSDHGTTRRHGPVQAMPRARSQDADFHLVAVNRRHTRNRLRAKLR